MDMNSSEIAIETLTPPISALERQWGMFAHFSSLLGLLGIPFANLLAPLVIWQIKKETMPFAASQAKECLNFQISITILSIVSFTLCFILIGFPLLLALIVTDVILTVLAGIKANEGVPYRYPFTIRIIK